MAVASFMVIGCSGDALRFSQCPGITPCSFWACWPLIALCPLVFLTCPKAQPLLLPERWHFLTRAACLASAKAAGNCGFGREHFQSSCLTSVSAADPWERRGAAARVPVTAAGCIPAWSIPRRSALGSRVLAVTQSLCSLSDPFVKIQLVHGLKLTKTKKTSCMRRTIDPFYNESFSFKVPQEELENASLVFTGKCSAVLSLPCLASKVSEVNKEAVVGLCRAVSAPVATLQEVTITGVSREAYHC